MEKTIQHGSIRLWVESFGELYNPAIVLIAGAMAPATLWNQKFCEYLASKNYFVIRYDHRDTGLSSIIDYTQNPYIINDLVSDTLAIINSYNVEKAHLIGISMGGTTAELCALTHKDLCSSITLISTPYPGDIKVTEQEHTRLEKTWELLLANKPTLDFKESLYGFLRSYEYLNGTAEFDKNIAQAYIEDLYMRSNHMFLTKDKQIKAFEVPHNHVRAQAHVKLTKQDLQKITDPTLIIHGQEDYLMLPSHAQATHKAIPNSHLEIIPKMGHMIFNRDLEQKIADLILDLVNTRENQHA